MQSNTIKVIVLLFENFVNRISLSINSDADSTKLVAIAESSSCNKSLSRFHYFSHIQKTVKLHKHLQPVLESFSEGKSSNGLEAWRSRQEIVKEIIIGDGSVKRKYRAAATVPNTRTRPCEATSSSSRAEYERVC